MKRHPLSEVWGDIPPDQFAELVEDVREHGVRDPVVCHDEMILDGWHRYRAAGKADQSCKFIALSDNDDPADFVISRNLHRRHLTVGQRAMIAEKIANLARGGDRHSEKFQSANLHFERPVTRVEAARKLGVSKRSADTAADLKKTSPEAASAVERGEMTLNAAARKAGGEDSKPQPAKPTPAALAKLRKENELLEAELTEAKLEINELRTKNDELEERIAFVQGESKPVAAVREEKFNNYRAHIQTLKHSVYRWQTQFQESNAENKALRRRLRALGENIRP